MVTPSSIKPSPYITFGRHSYSGTIVNTFNVKVNVGHFSSIANILTVLGGNGQHGPVMNKKAVSTFPLDLLSKGISPSKGKGPINIGNDVWIGRMLFC